MPSRRMPVIALGAGFALLAADAAVGDMLDTDDVAPWEVCGHCHGLDGVSAMPRFPKLAGQPAAYLEKQVQDFLSGARSNDGGQMQTVVAEIPAEDIPRVAAYFADLTLPFRATTAPVSREATLARSLVEDGDERVDLPACRSCHGGRGPSSASTAPRLEGQHSVYLAKQLREFRSGERANDPDGAMRAIARKLSDPQIEALSAYLAAQPGLPLHD
jgi:cytochrome c553